MAGLVSPGVQVQVIDESFYTPAEPGTIPLIFVASRENKANASNTGIAQGTLSTNAGKPYLISSQRELADFFGDPIFEVDENNNPIHGGELNEYGLQAAYSYLGVSNRAFIVRADVDLTELEPSIFPPTSFPPEGSLWLDLSETKFGIQEWNGSAKPATNAQTFTNKAPISIYRTNDVVDYDNEDYTPKGSIGAIGSYAVVSVTDTNRYWYKNYSGTWVELGSAAWTKSWATIKSSKANPTLTAGAANITINGTVLSVDQENTTTIAANINALVIDGVTAANRDGYLEIYSDGTSSGADDSSLGGPIVLGGDATKLTELGLVAGTYYPPTTQVSRHVTVPEWKTNDTYSRPSGSVWLKTSTPNGGMNVILKKWNSATLLWDEVDALVYDTNAAALEALDISGGGINLAAGVTYTKVNVDNTTPATPNFKVYERAATGATTITTNVITSTNPGAGTFTFTVASTDATYSGYSTPVTVSAILAGSAVSDAEIIADAINAADVPNITCQVTDQAKLIISHSEGGEIQFVDTDGMLENIGFIPYSSTNPVSMRFLDFVDGTDATTSPKQFQATNWRGITYTASVVAPFDEASQGQLWYNPTLDEVDIMYHDGSSWVGYRTATAFPNTDVNGPQVRVTRPTTQSNGNPLVSGDIWISTGDLEQYPLIYIFDDTVIGTIEDKWGSPKDNTDQTTEEGVLFADARYGTDGGTATQQPVGTIPQLLLTSYLDPDAPDPDLYPKGMLLFNLRRSGFNVKRYEKNYIDLNANNPRFIDVGTGNDEDMADYFPHRWVTESPNTITGAGSFGRLAQRATIVRKLQAAANDNETIRDSELYVFNLLSCPGYPELTNELITLNYDRDLTAFIVADTPFRLSNATPDLQQYATNALQAAEDNEKGILSSDPYLAYYYPSGFTSDNFGNNVVVPASHMMLRTISLSDQVSYPWFAPAGTRRGQITNASSTGYVTSEGEFQVASLSIGQRDTLYENRINPITFINGSGLVAFGQKTRYAAASSLDRINVARLVIYLRQQLKKLAKPYLFEPNDKITRDEVKASVESLMLELVGNRALYDFLVVCDQTNNTPARIDRNELYIDIAIEPVKAIEFIYIPLRIKNTGEIGNL